MSIRSYVSKIYIRSENRLNGLLAIDDKLDLGSGLTAKALRDAGASLAAAVATHNRAVAEVNALRADVTEAEHQVAELFARALAAVAARYGRDSREYKQAGGVRTSDRKRPHRQARPATNGAAAHGAAASGASEAGPGSGVGAGNGNGHLGG